MKYNPEALKLLASKLNAHPEWTGPNGVFFNPSSGYTGVKIFVGYVKHLKLTSGNKIPGTLPLKAKDYLHYLNELPEDKKKEYSSYFQRTVPKIYNMIRDAKMTKESILEFANIFNELEIGQNPATIISDYQTAISDAFKLKVQPAGNGGDNKSQSSSQNETYHQLALSEKEKASVIESCRQKGVIISSDQLDNYYVGSTGSVYSGDGTSVTNPVIGVALAQTLQYQVGIGNTNKLALKSEEIVGILKICEIKGIKITKEDLENIYIDKDGQLYSGDGTMITDVNLGTAIKQTASYAEAYENFAEKRGVVPVAEETRDDAEEPKVVNPEVALPPKVLIGTKATEEAGEAADRAREGVSQTIRTRGGIVSPTGGVMPLNRESLKSMTLSNGFGMNPPKSVGSDNQGWRVGSNGRQRIHGKKSKGRVSDQKGGPDQMAGNPAGQTPGQPTSSGRAMGENTDSTQSTQPRRKKRRWLAGAAGLGGSVVLGKSTIAATLFTTTTIIDNHYLISTILKIIFK